MALIPFTRGQRRGLLLACSALSGALMANAALSQAASGKTGTTGLQEIVVTAQKRAQNLQDVPIAVTAVTAQSLQTNRIATVQDLGALAPNLAVTPAAGSVGLPFFAMRGLLSQGNVSGQDKSVPIYVDGVPIGSADGQAFDLPDVERIEVLRGPQGTLFGRNSTGGAISIYTRDPVGELHVDQSISVGNYNQVRSVTRLNTPTFGPFSALISYTHDARRGDVKNLGAGTEWDYTVAGLGKVTSPKYLGSKDVNSVFAALKFDPGGDFKTVYKFQWTENHFTPDATGVGVFTPEILNFASPGFGDYIRSLYNANPFPIAGGHRPDAVNNSFTYPGFQRVFGHNLTSTWHAANALTVKNILGYRNSYIRSDSQLDGAGGLLAAPGYPFLLFANNIVDRSRQFSDELQLNYDSKLLTLTAGALYFHVHDISAAPDNLAANQQFTVIPGFTFTDQPHDANLFKEDSYAGYAQAELHLAKQVDVVGGIRVTRDEKSGVNTVSGINYPVDYAKTKPTYSIGINYKPTQNILAYAKYSTGFVAGGQVNSIAFKPETVKSSEIGLKTDWFDHHFRFNVTGFVTHYKNLQSVVLGATLIPPQPALGLFVVSGYDLHTKGVEIESSVAPFRGFTLDGSFGYTAFHPFDFNALLVGSHGLQNRPHYTANVAAQYLTQPLFDDARLMASVDASWRSKELEIGQDYIAPEYLPYKYSPAGWILNGRLSLQNIELPHGNLELAVWAKNITNSDRVTYGVNFSYLYGANYEPARTFGFDATVHF